MKKWLLFLTGVGLAASPSCQPSFSTAIPGKALQIEVTGGATGTPEEPLPLSFTTPATFVVSIKATDENGTLDTSFNGYVRLAIQPGNLVAVIPPNAPQDGLNVQLQGGEIDGVKVQALGTYGNARILATDLGYKPADPTRVPPPECANGIDDNDNGLIDYGVDPGCYAPNDDTEDGGSYASAASDLLYFVYPRIADVNGVNNSGAGTPFPNVQVEINTEWNGTSAATPQGVVVTAVVSGGFLVTDIGETRGYASVYAYNYTAPPLMEICDRLISFGGTSAEFYGQEELNYPTWSIDTWDPTQRDCLVPPPIALSASVVSGSTTTLLTDVAGLVQVPAVGCSGLVACMSSATFPASEKAAALALIQGNGGTNTALTSSVTLPADTLPVNSTYGYPHTGSLVIETATSVVGVTYTDITNNSFTGVACGAPGDTVTDGTDCCSGTSSPSPGNPKEQVCTGSPLVLSSGDTIEAVTSAGYAQIPVNNEGFCQTMLESLQTSGVCEVTTAHIATKMGPGLVLNTEACSDCSNVCCADVPASCCPGQACSNDSSCTSTVPAPPTGTIPVLSTTGFPKQGSLYVNASGTAVNISYTGITANSFTGATVTSMSGSLPLDSGTPVLIGSIQPDATSCDYEGTGKIDFEDASEAACEDLCSADSECSEYTQFLSESQFAIVVTDISGGQPTAGPLTILGDGAAASTFNPLEHLGSPVSAFTGNLMYFSGGNQFTIQARCSDDIVLGKGGAPLPPHQACVVAANAAGSVAASN